MSVEYNMAVCECYMQWPLYAMTIVLAEKSSTSKVYHNGIRLSYRHNTNHIK